MSGGNRYDRGAPLALGLILGAVVLVAGISAFSELLSQPVASGGPGDEQQNYEDTDYHIWGDSWAQWAMAAFAVVATGVSWRGLYLLRRTFEETKRTADAADLSVQQALEANRTAREIGEAQVRAYLACTTAELSIDEVFVMATINFKNGGQSPALWCEVKGGFRVAYTNLDGSTVHVDVEPTDGVDAAIQSGGQGQAILVWFQNKFPGDSLNRMRAPKGSVHLECRIQWMDIFRRTHVEYFQFWEIAEEMEFTGVRGVLNRSVTLNARSMPATTEHLRKQQREA